MATYTSDFEIVNLLLYPIDGTEHNIRFIMTEINVYEDIWNNQITVDVLVNDATNMIQNLPLFGFSKLLLEFRRMPDGDLWSHWLRLVRITDRKLIRERQSGYILHFVTYEGVNNMKKRVSKSYKGKLISDIVADLHYNWLGGGAIDIEKTKYQHHIIIPKIFPCHAINWLATRANSVKYLGANYLYYQDKDLFRFVTMESRLELPISQSYGFQVANIRQGPPDGHKAQDIATNSVAVQNYQFTHYSDILENMQAGMYANELYTHSHSRKIWRDYKFDYPGSFDDYKHLYNSPGSGGFLNLSQNINPKTYLFNGNFGDDKPDSKLKLHATGHDQDGFPFLPEKWIPIRISQLQQLQNIKVTMTVPGDSSRTVGQVVELRIPSPEPPINNQQVDDKYYSGRFLIASLRHKIDTEKFLTTMELIKDSVKIPYQNWQQNVQQNIDNFELNQLDNLIGSS
jgi:hypothetical protein